MADSEMLLMNILCQRFLGQEDKVADMRAFKNQIRNIREALAEQISSGIKEEELIAIIKEKKAEIGTQPVPQTPSQTREGSEEDTEGAVTAAPDDQSEEKKRIITTTLKDEKYKAIRDILLKYALVDPKFDTFQVYLDNIFAPAARLITKDLTTFSQGVQKIKEFRDTLEKELSS